MFKFVLPILLLISICSVSMADRVGVANIADVTTKVISLDSPDWEFSTLVVKNPTATRMGGALSYRFLESRDNSIWADLGAVRYDNSFDPLFGFSTNMPFGGRLLEENTRIGAWYLLKSETIAVGIRIPF